MQRFYIFNKYTNEYVNIDNKGNVYISNEMKTLYRNREGAQNVIDSLNNNLYEIIEIGGEK